MSLNMIKSIDIINEGTIATRIPLPVENGQKFTFEFSCLDGRRRAEMDDVHGIAVKRYSRTLNAAKD